MLDLLFVETEVGISVSAADGLVFLLGHPGTERPLVILEPLRQALLTALDPCDTQTTPFALNWARCPGCR
jgi:hypothetical protein